MKKIKKIYRQDKLGISASEVYIPVDDGSEELKGKPIEDIGGGGYAFDLPSKDFTANVELDPTACKTFYRSNIDSDITITADVSGLSDGDEVFIKLKEVDGSQQVLTFGTGMNLSGGSTKINVPSNNYLYLHLVKKNSNLMVVDISTEQNSILT